MAIKLFKSRVVENKTLTSKFHLIRLELLEEKDSFVFQSGQFIVLKVSDSIVRSYSVASTPAELPYWELFVDVTPNGPGSQKVKSLKTGDIIETTNPRGIFTLGDTDTRHFIMGATGCGFASIKPMVEELLSRGEGNVYLLWGLRYEKDVCLQELLKSWKDKFANFSYDIVLSQPQNNWTGKKGHINPYLLEKVKNTSFYSTSVYLCGNQPMIEEISNQLKEISFPESEIYHERYY